MEAVQNLKYVLPELQPPVPELTRAGTERFLGSLEEAGKSAETVKNYARSLNKLNAFLPADKRITAEALADWRDAMLAEGAASATVNMRISAANGYLAFMGRRDLQLLNQLEKVHADVPELTRGEYLRLLQTARALHDDSAYFIVKLFGSTGIRPRDLPKVTLEAAEAGAIQLADGTIILPKSLQEELLSYAKRQGKRSGPLIVQRDGRPMARTTVNKLIERLCRDARVSEERASPKCLRQLYRQTYGEIEDNVAALIRQAYEHLLETEQTSIGWK